MAGKKISQLTALGGSFAAADLFEISKDMGAGAYASRKITGTELITSIGAGTGTVTSVAIAGGTTGLTVTGSPITTAGTITIGGALVAANGGTGQTSYSTGDLLYASGATAISKLAVGSNTEVLTLAGGVPTWAAPAGGGASDLDGLTDVEVVAAGGSAAQYSIFLSNGSTAGGAPQHGTLSAAIANIAIGPGALSNITQGDYNVALGYKSLEDIVSGGFNTGMGYSSLTNTTGSGNTAVGYNAGGTNTSGSYNTYIGGDMGGVNSGLYQIGIGWGVYAGGSNTFALGKTSKTLLHGEYGTTGDAKLGINLGTTWQTPTATLHIKGGGSTYATVPLLIENSSGQQIMKLTDAGSNICIGKTAGDSITGGGGLRNVTIGDTAGTRITGGDDIIAIGNNSVNGDAGMRNVGIGVSALGSTIMTGQMNTSVGAYSGTSNQSGHRNTFFGYSAGYANTTGAYNTCVGLSSDCSATVDNQVAIGYSTVTDGVNKIRIGNSSMATANIQIDWTIDSDERIKDNITDGAIGLDFINALRPVTFTKKHPADWDSAILEDRYKSGGTDYDDENDEVVKDEFDSTSVIDGLIAQEVKATIDSLGVNFSGWSEDTKGKQGVQYAALVVPLIKAVQELSAKVAALENK